MKYLVGSDEGTTGCKVCVFTENGELVAYAGREYPSYYPHNGWVEQNIDEIREAVFASCKEAIAKANIDPKDIVGVSHSNQCMTMVFIDENGQLVSNRTVGWQDLRHVDMLPELRQHVNEEEYFKISGTQFASYNIPVLLWHQRNNPEMWERVRRICSHQDYFLKCYGADGYYIDEGNASFLSMARVNGIEWDERLTSVFNVSPNMLSKIIHVPGQVVGEVPPDVALKTGLPVGCKVCMGGADTNSCSMGAGAKDPGTESLVMGTAGVSIMIVDKILYDPNNRITIRSNPGFGNHQLYLMTNTGASAFRWFRDAICSMEVATGKIIGADPYDLITAAASQSQPGANGVTALTCIQGAHTRKKNEKARGGFLGVNLGTTKGDLAEAILEGICFEMRDILDMKTELAGQINKIRLGGGVAKSQMWCQMFADVLEKPVEVTEVQEMGCLGAAMCAAIGAGIFKDPVEAIEKCVRVKRVYVPNEHLRDEYEKAFLKWQNAYGACNDYIYK